MGYFFHHKMAPETKTTVQLQTVNNATITTNPLNYVIRAQLTKACYCPQLYNTELMQIPPLIKSH